VGGPDSFSKPLFFVDTYPLTGPFLLKGHSSVGRGFFSFSGKAITRLLGGQRFWIDLTRLFDSLFMPRWAGVLLSTLWKVTPPQ